MDKKNKKIIRTFTIMVCIAAVILAGFYYISREDGENTAVSSENETEVDKLLGKDLDDKYPETPVEVVKMYWRINKCIYNTSLKDEEFDGLLKQLRKMYDEELLNDDDNSWKAMSDRLKKDKAEYAEDKKTISTYTVEQNSSVKYGKVDGKDCATVITATMIKKKTERSMVYEKFLCRKDSGNNWRILGWDITKDKDEIASVISE